MEQSQVEQSTLSFGFPTDAEINELYDTSLKLHEDYSGVLDLEIEDLQSGMFILKLNPAFLIQQFEFDDLEGDNKMEILTGKSRIVKNKGYLESKFSVIIPKRIDLTDLSDNISEDILNYFLTLFVNGQISFPISGAPLVMALLLLFGMSRAFKDFVFKLEKFQQDQQVLPFLQQQQKWDDLLVLFYVAQQVEGKMYCNSLFYMIQFYEQLYLLEGKSFFILDNDISPLISKLSPYGFNKFLNSLYIKERLHNFYKECQTEVPNPNLLFFPSMMYRIFVQFFLNQKSLSTKQCTYELKNQFSKFLSAEYIPLTIFLSMSDFYTNEVITSKFHQACSQKLQTVDQLQTEVRALQLIVEQTNILPK